MSFIYIVFIYPLELLFEISFSFFQKAFSNYGFSIVGLSLVATIVTLPLYHIAEKIQQKERNQRKNLASGVKRIKETFNGDEQFMMLSTFYRQNDYHPVYVLRGSFGLLIQIPFFIAAYHFLSNLELLQGASFSIIQDLGRPDQLLKIGNISVNFLPVLMTIINIISGVIYTKGFAFRDKIQLYGMAGIFLVLLYNSPAGLVLYWTANNLLSLIKNVFYKLKNPLKLLYILAVSGVAILVIAIWIFRPTMKIIRRSVLVLGWVVVVFAPLYTRFLSKTTKYLELFATNSRVQDKLFYSSIGVLTLLCGLVIPTNLISSSVIEFSHIGLVGNPLTYIGYTLLTFMGIWVVWPFFLYKISNHEVRMYFSLGLTLIALISTCNVFLFPGDYGHISYLMQIEGTNFLPAKGAIFWLPLALTLGTLITLVILLKRKHYRVIQTVLSILLIGLSGSGLYSAAIIEREFQTHIKNLKQLDEMNLDEIEPKYHFSKTGKNVVFIFLDRAAGSFFPHIVEEQPQLREQFHGFTYYPNTVSFGGLTLYGAPAMLGGYEYTPDEFNKRTNEKMVDKYNEALLVLPRLFADAEYSVTLNDPPISNFKGQADFTPFHPYPEMDVLYYKNAFSPLYKAEHTEDLDLTPGYENSLILRYLPMFSFFKIGIPLLREIIYEDGKYFLSMKEFHNVNAFIAPYSHLYYLRELSAFDGVGDVYINVNNETPHDPILLQTPEYEPRRTVSGEPIPFAQIPGVREIDLLHYLPNVAALKRVGLWMDQLREEGVFDNTRIVIVSDHSQNLWSKRMEDFQGNGYKQNIYVPLLLMKDFNSHNSLSIDNTFMTNADAPLFAIQGLTDEVNPFTGNNLFEVVQKERVNVYSGSFNLREYTGTQYSPYLSISFSIGEDIFVEDNWGPVEVEGAKQ